MDDDLRDLIPELRTYLLHYPVCPEGVRELFESHGYRIIDADEAEFLEFCEIREFAELPCEGSA